VSGEQPSFDDLMNQMNDIFGKGPSGFGTQFNKEEKGVAWEAKIISGQIYVPLGQVLTLLKSNGILPKMQERIKNNLAAQAERNTLDL
jgi:hypothetical protein